MAPPGARRRWRGRHDDWYHRRWRRRARRLDWRRGRLTARLSAATISLATLGLLRKWFMLDSSPTVPLTLRMHPVEGIKEVVITEEEQRRLHKELL